jgi:hypothetical protein
MKYVKDPRLTNADIDLSREKFSNLILIEPIANHIKRTKPAFCCGKLIQNLAHAFLEVWTWTTFGDDSVVNFRTLTDVLPYTYTCPDRSITVKFICILRNALSDHCTFEVMTFDLK